LYNCIPPYAQSLPSGIDLDAARKRGIAVFDTPGVLSEAVAEVAMPLLLGAARRATESVDLIGSGLVPLLRRRSLFPDDPRSGTLRDRLGWSRPPNRYASAGATG